MQLARVVGTVVATQKHPKFEGAKLLLVQPLTLDDQPRGTALLAVDSVGAGVHEKVLIVHRGARRGRGAGPQGRPGGRRHHRHRGHGGRSGMTEQELRALVREAIARHVSGTAVTAPIRRHSVTAGSCPAALPTHASHGLFVVPDGVGRRRALHHRACGDVQPLRLLQVVWSLRAGSAQRAAGSEPSGIQRGQRRTASTLFPRSTSTASACCLLPAAVR